MKKRIKKAQKYLEWEKPNQAIAELQPVLKNKHANSWVVHHMMGVALAQKGNYKSSVNYLNGAVDSGSDEAGTYHMLSVCHYNLGHLEEAEGYAREALNRKENFFEAWLNLGSINRSRAQLDEALKCYRKANQLNPKHAGVAFRIGEIYRDQGDLDKAFELFDITLQVEPDYFEAVLEKVDIRKKRENYEEAKRYIKEASEKFGGQVRLKIAEAEIYKAEGDFEGAIQKYEKLLKQHPKNSAIRSNYALCLQALGLFEESEQNYLKAIKDQSGLTEPVSNYLMGLHYNPANTKEKIFGEHIRLAKAFLPEEQVDRPVPENKAKDKRLNIGFISGGFRRHPVGWMIAEALKYLPKEQFRIYCYTTNNIFDYVTREIHPHCYEWNAILGYSDKIKAEIIRKDEIDILVDLSGHSEDSCLKAMALEPAPVIVKWIGGLFNTTGLPAFDFLISDWQETPEGEEAYCTEKLVRMPDDYISYMPPADAPDVGPLPAIENGYITFGCFNNPTKVNEQVLTQWARIMNEVPESRLFLKSKQYDTPSFKARITEVMEQQGIAKNRLLFKGQTSHKEHLDACNEIDIALDPWPYSGGLTTCESLYMGVPVITLPGPTFAGRHSATHLINAGLPELVTDSWDEYAEKAIALAGNYEKLQQMRKNLRGQLISSPVCDGKRFAAHLSAAFRKMWHQWVDGCENNIKEWQDHIEVKALPEKEVDEAVSEQVSVTAGTHETEKPVKQLGKDEAALHNGDFTNNMKVNNNGAAKTVHHQNGQVADDSKLPERNGHDQETFKIEAKDNVIICTPADLDLLTPYVLLEQEEWFEPELNFLREYVRPGMKAVDIGAAFGVYALPLAKLAGKEGAVYAFEPGSIARHHLEMSKLENRLDNLEVIGRALGASTGKAKLKTAETPELNTIDEAGNEEIFITTLDAWWNFAGQPELDVIKLDTNGTEPEVLQGASKMLEKTSPVVLASIGEGEDSLGKLRGQLKEMSYRLFEFIPAPQLLAPHEPEAGVDPYLMNIIAIKESRVSAFKKAGWIYDESVEPKVPKAGQWKETLGKLPWASSLLAEWDEKAASGKHDEYLQALDMICAAEEIDLRTDEDHSARSRKGTMMLEAAQKLVGIFNSGKGSVPAAMTLARVMYRLGKRGQAVEIMKGLMETVNSGGDIDTSLPFLPPLSAQDATEIKTDSAKWLTVRVVEAWIMMKDPSTFMSGEQERKMLEALEGNPEIGSQLERRIQLITGQYQAEKSGSKDEHKRKIIPDTFWQAPSSQKKADIAVNIAEKLQSGEISADDKKDLIEECQSKIDTDGTDSFAFFMMVNGLLSLETSVNDIKQDVLLSQLKSKGWAHKYNLYNYFFSSVERISDVNDAKLSVIIVSNKVNDEVLKNLKEVDRQKDEAIEVIFVSNDLDKDVTKKLKKYVDVLVHLNQNAGACMARNFGALFSGGNLFMFIDDDGIPEEGMLKAHQKIHAARDVYVARGVYLPKKKGGEIPWHYDLGSETKPAVCFLEGNTSFRPEPFFEVGGWNDRILVYHEGLELSYRYYNAGYEQEKLIYFPEAVLRHDYVKLPAGQSRKNKLLQISHHLVHAMHKDVDRVINSWPAFFTNSDKELKKGKPSSRYKALSKVVYLAPGNTDMAYGLHNTRAKVFHDLTLKEGVESEIIYLTDPQFLQKMVDLSKNPGHAVYSGVMGYPSWVTIDRVQSANLFDLLDINMFALLGDHLFANFMWQRLEKMGTKTTFYANDKSVIEELEVFGHKENPSFVIDNTASIIEIDKKKAQAKLNSRDIDVLIPWAINYNIANRKNINTQLSKMGKRVFDVGQIFINEMKKNPDIPVLPLFRKAYSSVVGGSYVFSKKKTKEDYVWMNMLHLVDQHIRHWKRFNMLETLTEMPSDSKIVITSDKKNAKTYSKLLSQNNIEWVGQVTAGQLNQLYARSKIVMNSNPTYPNCLHGRIKNGMGWGCCVVSDSTPGLKKRFKDKQHILFANNETTVADFVKDSSLDLQEIADNGRTIINKSYTKEGYCRALLEQMNDSIK